MDGALAKIFIHGKQFRDGLASVNIEDLGKESRVF
jgi:hypothetical protein